MSVSLTKQQHRAIWLATALMASVGLGCGGASAAAPRNGQDGSAIYLDAGFDGQTDSAGRDAALVSCTLERTIGPSSFGCRADWSCPGAGLYTFFCGPADAGAATCYCQASGGMAATRSGACTGDGGDFATEAMRACGWPFASTSRDGGGQ
jgi:hypothetical protein